MGVLKTRPHQVLAMGNEFGTPFKSFKPELLSNVVYGLLKWQPVFDRQFV
jgi:hypothetical protein